MSDRDRQSYRRLCQSGAGLPIFSQAWWLDATCGPEGWDVAVVERQEEILAALPYRQRRRMGFIVLDQPRLTQTLGPWLRPGTGKAVHNLGHEMDLLAQLVLALPSNDQYVQNWSHQRQNWLPFYWAGFTQTTRYSYILRDLGNVDALWKGMRENIRRETRKAEQREGVAVDHNADLEVFLSLNDLTFARQGRKPPYAREYVRQLDAACKARNCRRILIARDMQGRAHAGAYIVWDEQAAYYLMGGGDPELRNSGATSLCLWEAIRFAAGVTRSFDFEGSMLQPVERFFRAFGAEQIPFFRVCKTNSLALRGLSAFRVLRGDA